MVDPRALVLCLALGLVGSGCRDDRPRSPSSRAATGAGDAGTAAAAGQGTAPAREAAARRAAELEAGCRAGTLESCRGLGVVLAEGAGVPADPARARELFAR